MTEIVDRAIELLETELERANGDVFKIDLEVLFLKLVEEGWSEDESSDALEKGEDLRRGKAAVESHPDFRLGKGIPHPFYQAAQNTDGTGRTRRIPRPQHRRYQVLLRFLIKGQKTNHWQVTVATVVAIEKGELLLAVRGVVGGIQVDGDATGATL